MQIRLLSIEGVASVTREGGVDRTIRVVLDPSALQAQGITAAPNEQAVKMVCRMLVTISSHTFLGESPALTGGASRVRFNAARLRGAIQETCWHGLELLD